jgi:competence protein ComEA
MIRMFVPFLAIAVLATMNPSVAGAAQRKAGPRAGAKPAVTSAVNINSASASQLEALPGIGAKTAARIIDYRQKNGPFKKIEELMNVRGVGEKNFLKLKPQIVVSAAKADHAPQ